MKKIALILFLILALASDASVQAETLPQTDTEATSAQESKPRSKVQELVANNTPEFIKKSVAISAEMLEDFRLGALTAIEAKKNRKTAELQILKEKETIDPIVALEEDGRIERINPLKIPFKTLEIYVLMVVGAIFEQKIVFYGLALLILIIILRYIFD